MPINGGLVTSFYILITLIPSYHWGLMEIGVGRDLIRKLMPYVRLSCVYNWSRKTLIQIYKGRVQVVFRRS